MSVIIDNLTATYGSDLSIGIAFIYCNFRRQNDQNTDQLLASLLKQLAKGQPMLPGVVKDLYDCHRTNQTQPSAQEISEALQSVAAMYSRVFIIVDALDEFQASSDCRTRFLAELFDL